VVAGGRLLVGSCAGLFSAIDPATGRTIWSYDITRDGKQSSFHGEMYLEGETVFIGTDDGDGHVYAFDVETGVPRWKLRAGRGVPTDITPWGDDLFAVTLDDTLLSVDRRTGAVNWAFGTGAEVEARFTLGTTPAVHDGVVYFGGLDGWVYAFECETGEETWRIPLESQIITSNLMWKGSLFTATADSAIHRLDPWTGEVEASAKLDGRLRGEMIPVGDFVIATLAWDAWDGEIVAFDHDLDLLWRASPPEGLKWTTARPFLLDRWILTGSQAGRIFAIDPANGAVAWTSALDGERDWEGDGVRVFGRHESTLFVGTIFGMLYALEWKGF